MAQLQSFCFCSPSLLPFSVRVNARAWRWARRLPRLPLSTSPATDSGSELQSNRYARLVCVPFTLLVVHRATAGSSSAP